MRWAGNVARVVGDEKVWYVVAKGKVQRPVGIDHRL